MATAKELGLREGDVVRLGTNLYELVPCYTRDTTQLSWSEKVRLPTDPALYRSLPKRLAWGMEGRGLDMTRGARVRVLKRHESGTIEVVYLDDAVSLARKGGEIIVKPEREAGYVCSIWNGYVGFIPPVSSSGQPSQN
ncbi:MAG: hypothetical protein HYW26_03585 [Candidatus Aenigmarchaeota archaeon]|nr:hypothetical protein [Candidatus Aenigmarchaeota archaeon]